MNLAPIALFVYNRPEHTRRVLQAIKRCKFAGASELYVFADGPGPEATEDTINKIREVRNLVRSIDGFRKVTTVESQYNKGLSKSITSGIQNVFERHDRIIVFEDDILAHPNFLQFCNEALERYASAENVYAVSGYMYPVKARLKPTFFMRTGAVWGWGCWKRSWEHFEPDSDKLIEEIKKQHRIREFNFNDSFDYYGMLKQHHEGKISSWDVCWYASIFIRNGLTYYPNKSLTQNIGMDGSGTHYQGASLVPVEFAEIQLSHVALRSILEHFPMALEADRNAQAATEQYFLKLSHRMPVQRLRTFVRRLISGTK